VGAVVRVEKAMMAMPALSGSSEGWSWDPPSGKIPTAFPAISASLTAANMSLWSTRGVTA
jgi:hypothetical protein